MPQSLAKVCTHIVFSTKHRQPLIDEKIENELWSYMGGICNSLECLPIKIGGYVITYTFYVRCPVKSRS